MWKRAIPLLVVCSLAAALVFTAAHMSANPPASKDPPPGPGPGPAPADKAPAKEAASPTPGVKAAASRVAAVTVYPNSALVTREVDVPEGPGTVELTVTPLPPSTINTSLYSEGTESLRVLTTRFRSRPILEDNRADVRKLQDELEELELSKEKLDADVKAIQANTQLLAKMEGFTAMQAHPMDKGPPNSDSAIAMAKYIMDCRAEKAKELVGLEQQVRANLKKAEFVRRKLTDLSAAGPARTERDAVLVVEKSNAAAGKVRLHYLVDAASWRPQYKLHAGKAAKDPVHLEYLAAVVQQSGEDWSNVELVLSTAQPMLNAAPPELQTLQVTVVPRGASPAGGRRPNAAEVDEEVKGLRSKAQKDFNDKKPSSAVGLVNTAAALDQSFELFNPEAAMKRGCALGVREGPTVAYHLSAKLSVPSRNDEQVLEVARIDLAPEYYYKATPVLSTQVYRQADLTNKSQYVLLPGDATMYHGSDFVGQMSLPLVAVGERFTAGFGVDPQLQVQRQMTDKARSVQGANQLLRYEYRILVSSYKAEPVKVQVWERLPHAENEAVGVSLLKAAPEVSRDALYQREQRPNNLLRWDVTVEPAMSGEKALPITYEFKLELDRQMTISSFQTSGVLATASAPASAAPPTLSLTDGEKARVKAEMAKLSPEDRKLAEAQVFCAVDQDSPLGTMGPIRKVVIKGQPVFLCCKGCETEAGVHPDEVLGQFQKLMARMAPKK